MKDIFAAPIIKMPLFAEEIKGIETLKEAAQALYE
jgi:anion-transporting  ArsA/GET3 family ATPase